MAKPRPTCAKRSNLRGRTLASAPEQPSSTFESERTRTNMSSHYYASTTDLLLQNLSYGGGKSQLEMLRQRSVACFLLDVRLSSRVQQRTMGGDQRCCSNILGTLRTDGHPTTTRATPPVAKAQSQHGRRCSVALDSLQTRVMQYRYTEIKEGGYVTEHVQLPLIVDYPDEFLYEMTWQELMNCWANQGLGQR